MLRAFPAWRGAKLVVALSQGTPWLLVLRADLPARRGDIGAVKGLRIGAAAGPDHAFLQLLRETGSIPRGEGITIGPVPGAAAPEASFGVLAAKTLERGLIGGFWANALGRETAVRRGVGKVWSTCGGVMARPRRGSTRSLRSSRSINAAPPFDGAWAGPGVGECLRDG